ncbi:ZIP family metal transporter [Staphylococcus auricularis]|uniref:ZIP family metal transporter n=1 Tax=Staphylococcus auricularis TaxID=29379 RepID=A0ABX5IF98_9STAP|nr:ZIP family metal transporter [Staphylococcus auricularis]MCE5037493.1 ZIP family metal transporter [Staphylococcus auricularis]MEB6569984.1 ZIP family metal transporter [Staphylococcus auricularis]PTH14135.1 ZIP family metal transporter [Staphylococcus auricularis]PTH27310.1 ZIP family metal transporter [Staphylococcus auricularis]
MAELFQNLPPAIQALSAGIVTWLLTALGAAAVFVFKTMNDKILNTMQGFAAGIMIAASFWSLLQPAIEYNEDGAIPWLPAAIGFLLGGIFIRGLDFVIPHIHRNATDEHQQREGVKTKSLNKSTLLVLAITLHNIPEGLSIGVAFGGVVSGNGQATLLGALGLAIGIGIQNIPEGAAVSMPIRAEGASQWKAFNYGQLSAIVEPIFATVGAAAVLIVTPMLPYALAFAAGAMIFVCVEELIPESQSGNNTDLATLSLMVGFTIMMILDVALG